MTTVGRRGQVVYDQNSHMLFLLGLADIAAGEPGTPINNATVTAYIEDEDTTQVYPTPSGTFTLDPLGAGVAVTLTINGRVTTWAEGNYAGVMAEDIAWSTETDGEFKRHIAFVDADAGVNKDGHWEAPIYIQVRRR